MTEPSRRPPLCPFPDQPKPRLYDRMIEVLRVRHNSRSAEEAYAHWIRKYAAFLASVHPRDVAEADINRFLTHLAMNEHVAASTQNQALAALLFLYEHVLENPLDRIEGVVRAHRSRRLPVVMTTDEGQRVMTHLARDGWLGTEAKMVRGGENYRRQYDSEIDTLRLAAVAGTAFKG